MADDDSPQLSPPGVAPASLRLGVSVDLREATTVVHASGVIDASTAPRLWETTSSILREHPAVLVVDLTKVAFVDSYGLEILALVEERARPDTVLKLVAVGALGIAGQATGIPVYPELAEALVPAVPPAVYPDRRGKAGRRDDRCDELWRRVTRATESRISGTTCAETLCATVLRLVPELETVTLTLHTDEGATCVLAASHSWSNQVEELQYTTGEGPGITAFTRQREMIVPDLAATGHWPGFTHAADRIGVAAVFSFPLPAPLRLGALTFYRHHRGCPPEPVLADARALARISAVMLDRDDDLLDQVARTTGYDEVCHAAGILSVNLGVPTDEACVRIRAAAFANDMPVRSLARAVVADPDQRHRLLDL
ncbi:STAS domain-containing protein [Amycolatopsis sp. NPDC089917]|uniref:STAS domain-containing protein n=1 Tax=Amycolatopsis sp. NPDC089917 TaxID=3155187 RepID=UPI00343087A2